MDALHGGFDRPFSRLSDRLGGLREGALRLVSATVQTIALAANGSAATAVAVALPADIEEGDLVLVGAVCKTQDDRPYFVNFTQELGIYRYGGTSAAYNLTARWAWWSYQSDAPPKVWQGHTSARTYDVYVIVLRDCVVAGNAVFQARAVALDTSANWTLPAAAGRRSLGLLLTMYDVTGIEIVDGKPAGYASILSLSGAATSLTMLASTGRPSSPLTLEGVATLNVAKRTSLALGFGVFGS